MFPRLVTTRELSFGPRSGSETSTVRLLTDLTNIRTTMLTFRVIAELLTNY
jgi:hypothetical protein